MPWLKDIDARRYSDWHTPGISVGPVGSFQSNGRHHRQRGSESGRRRHSATLCLDAWEVRRSHAKRPRARSSGTGHVAFLVRRQWLFHADDRLPLWSGVGNEVPEALLLVQPSSTRIVRLDAEGERIAAVLDSQMLRG